tara:strand:- start:9 stop:797 length:789 start_codon:yes stop_codon:yes gene_type:complete
VRTPPAQHTPYQSPVASVTMPTASRYTRPPTSKFLSSGSSVPSSVPEISRVIHSAHNLKNNFEAQADAERLKKLLGGSGGSKSTGMALNAFAGGRASMVGLASKTKGPPTSDNRPPPPPLLPLPSRHRSRRSYDRSAELDASNTSTSPLSQSKSVLGFGVTRLEMNKAVEKNTSFDNNEVIFGTQKKNDTNTSLRRGSFFGMYNGTGGRKEDVKEEVTSANSKKDLLDRVHLQTQQSKRNRGGKRNGRNRRRKNSLTMQQLL